MWLVRWDFLTSSTLWPFLLWIFFHFFSCMFFLRRETCDIKGGGRLYLCEKIMEWDMEGHVAFFLIIGFALTSWMQ